MNSQKQHSRALFAIPAAVMLLALSGGVAAERVDGSFSHKDWDLTCDNTLTCRAIGYGAIAEEEGASVLLTRKAGSNEPVTNRVMLAHYGDDEWQEGSAPELIIAGRTAGALSFAGDEAWQMSEAQLAQFLTALKQDKPISFRENDDDYYSLSGAGSSAVLLKMDDVQGRVNTPGAIFRKGKNSESSVKAPIAIPVIAKAPVIDKYLRQMNAQEEAVFRPVILQALGADAETFCSEERLAEPLEIARLDEQRSLVVVSCWLAAYNSGDAYFEINNDMQSAPVLVSDSANGYDNGVISSGMKGRGLGDCWSYDEWVWNGTEFVSSKRGDTGRCMMMRVGGAWDIPLHVTKVVEQ